MKLLYFHQHFSTPKGSAGIRSYAMAKRLVEKGHQVTMVCGSYSGGHTGLEQPFDKGVRRGMVDGINVIEFQLEYSNQDGFVKRTTLFFKFALKSISVALSEHYDLLFATSTPLTAAIPGIIARWLRGKPFVFEVRDLWPELPREMGVINNPIVLWAMGRLEWAAYKSAHRLIGLSPGIVDGIARLNIPRHKIAMIPNGCDLTLFGNANAKSWRPSGVKDTDLMAVFAGTHGIANGLDSVLDAALVLKKDGRNDIKFVLIGQGKVKEKMIRRAKQEGLDNIIFHDPVSKEKLSGLMAATDVGLQVLANVPAFYYGTSPNKFFDYIACGLPVLNNYPGWLADMINENDCGLTVPPEDAKAFADSLVYLADHREKLLGMSAAASKLAKKRFDRSKLSQQFADWLVTGSSNNA
ncbi:glycosyltransferase family 4 protein [Endozoicomonas sp. ISHI1]|uniref:glycosyltransferase family 4 protein n=1 Tax=Endozoicomonas sp. ISHI1 TaxID=2825882 RepID=UPI00214797C8|nr:glycosyltransferase family 4 protein [Endozoicomonas sp. ISHI1]